MIARFYSFLVLAMATTIGASAFGQSMHYQRIATDESLRESYVKRVETECKAAKKGDLGAYKKDLKEYIDSRSNFLTSMAENDHLIIEQETHDYLNGFIEDIAKANPSYDFSQVKIYLTRYYWPNAFSVGEGTIGVNVGFIPYFDSVDEFVWVLCHELAHYALAHGENAVKKQLAYLEGDEFKEKVRDIKSSTYYQNTKLKELMIENLFSQRGHSRDQEQAADSLGLLLFLNTDYYTGGAVSGLAKLKTLNTIFDSSLVDVQQLLHALYPEVPASNGVKITNEDKLAFESDGDESLETHPDCDRRVEWVKNYAKENQIELKVGQTNDSEFDALKQRLQYEIIESYIFYLKFDRALITAARMLNADPDSEYLKGVISYTFMRMVKERNEYNLKNFASAPHENSDQSFTDLLNIMHYSRVKLLVDAGQEVLDDWFTKDVQTERLWVAQMIWLEMKDEDDQLESMKTLYDQRFPDGRYTSYVKYL